MKQQKVKKFKGTVLLVSQPVVRHIEEEGTYCICFLYTKNTQGIVCRLAAGSIANSEANEIRRLYTILSGSQRGDIVEFTFRESQEIVSGEINCTTLDISKSPLVTMFNNITVGVKQDNIP